MTDRWVDLGTTLPDRAAFIEEARSFNVIPVTRWLLADQWTPVTAFRRLAQNEEHAFLFESVEGGEREGRYSFLGRKPFLVLQARGKRIIASGDDAADVEQDGAPPDALRDILERYRSPLRPDLPPFLSGGVGYFAYDAVRWFERLPDQGLRPVPEADVTLFFPADVAAFDHALRRLTLVANARIHSGDDPSQVYDRARAQLDAMEHVLLEAAPTLPQLTPETPVLPAVADPSDFLRGVSVAKDHIRAGDIFQVVLSRRTHIECSASDLNVYRALRVVNDSR